MDSIVADERRLNYYHNMEHMEPVQPPVMIGCYSKISQDSKKVKAGMGDLYPGGVKRLLLLQDEKILVGSGSGNVELVKIINVLTNFNKGVKLPSTPQIRTVNSPINFFKILNELFKLFKLK